MASSAVLTKNKPMKSTMRMRIGGSHHHHKPNHIGVADDGKIDQVAQGWILKGAEAQDFQAN